MKFPLYNVFLCFLFSIFFSLLSFSQYNIPWATKQPAWVFPIWFENANGERDTIYLGYDSNAYNPTQPGFSSDSIFGEKLIKIDTSKFNMSICWTLFNNDTTYKVMVSYDFNQTSLCGDGSFELYAIHGWLPIKMSWDVSLFHSDSLPFPNQSLAPRAEGLIWMNGDATDSSDTFGCFSWGDSPILVTDSLVSGGGMATCVRRDSIIFKQVQSLQFQIRQWSGQWLSTEEIQNSKFKVHVFPNPFSYYATLYIMDDEQKIMNTPAVAGYELKIYDIIGKLVLKSEITNRQSEIKRGNLSDGIFFYEITNQKNQIERGKLIIQ